MAHCLKNPLQPKPSRPLAGPGYSSPDSSPKTRHPRLNFGGAGILNLLSIVYAHRPRLRSRLTLGGRTFPRKPWVYGGRGFYPSYRYSCLHSHLSILHGRLPFRFKAIDNAPLPIRRDESRRTPELRYTAYRQSFSAQDHSMSQLLRIV